MGDRLRCIAIRRMLYKTPALARLSERKRLERRVDAGVFVGFTMKI